MKSFPDTPGNFVSFNDVSGLEYFTLSGHLVDYNGKPEVIHMWDYGLLTDEMTTIKVSDSGDFVVTIPIYYSHEISFSIDNKVYVIVANPDNKIHMELDPNGGTKFYGDGALDAKVIQSYYANVRRKYNTNKPYNRGDLPKLDPLEYRKIVEKHYSDWTNDLTDFFDSLENRNVPISSFIKRNRLLEVELDYLAQINSFEASRKYRNEEKVKLQTIPKGFYEDLTVQNIQLEEKDYIYEDLEILLDEVIYSDYLDKIRIKISKTGIAKKILKRAIPDITSIHYDWLFGHFYGYRGEIKFNDAMIADFLSNSNTGWLKKEIQRIHNGNDIQGEIVLSDGIDTTDVSEIEFDELLSSITAKHQGKTIYLDIWGTWCTNCIAQFGFADQLHEAVDKNKVAFVYMAARSDKNLWLRRINKSGLSGDHYFLSDSQYAKLAKKWKSPGLPQYVIIDPNGEIKNYNAPRPSENDKLNQDLISLLNSD